MAKDKDKDMKAAAKGGAKSEAKQQRDLKTPF